MLAASILAQANERLIEEEQLTCMKSIISKGCNVNLVNFDPYNGYPNLATPP